MGRIPVVALVLLAGFVAPAWGQTPVRLDGTVVAVEPGMMTVKPDDGALVVVVLRADTRYGTQVERSLTDIRPGEFVGSAAVRGRDGRLHAQEVHIFPEAMRGTGEGHRAMEQAEQTMTNANVDGVADAADGRVLTLRYAGGEQTIEVGPDVRVVGLVPGDASLLAPGVAVTVRAMRGGDGVLTAVAVQAEKDGVKPLP